MKLKKNIALSETGFLFNPSNGDSYSLNPIGIEILKMLQEEKTNDQIIKSITKGYMIDNSTVEKDIEDFKVLLKNYKLTE